MYALVFLVCSKTNIFLIGNYFLTLVHHDAFWFSGCCYNVPNVGKILLAETCWNASGSKHNLIANLLLKFNGNFNVVIVYWVHSL